MKSVVVSFGAVSCAGPSSPASRGPTSVAIVYGGGWPCVTVWLSSCEVESVVLWQKAAVKWLRKSLETYGRRAGDGERFWIRLLSTAVCFAGNVQTSIVVEGEEVGAVRRRSNDETTQREW